MTLEQRAHENHLRLGVANAHCALCPKQIPEWVKRAQEHRLPVKDYSRS